jgi:hypothetical protein
MRSHYATTVAICEGQKDADTVTNLKLLSADGSEIVATTSGSSDSWKDEFADDLKGKRVIIMPTLTGARYAADIRDSLSKRGIEHREIDSAPVGVKDVTDYMNAGNTEQELTAMIGKDWARTALDFEEVIDVEEV